MVRWWRADRRPRLFCLGWTRQHTAGMQREVSRGRIRKRAARTVLPVAPDRGPMSDWHLVDIAAARWCVKE
uniref:Uncharacterized protein n=1 Tax=Ralstonia syzygii R24 TaxID=907261 RepID=G3ACE4_9RALS|nr:hypothetical protein RALSY_mp30559 [Ralstonia syzygii R24]